MKRPELALLISTYQRPWHLARVLESVRQQKGVTESIEIVVTDDGSTDETHDVVREFSSRVPYRVAWTSHGHQQFHLARCRNEGVTASTARYLLFLDGDCLIPSNHLRTHLDRRKEGTVWGGFCYHLDEPTSELIDLRHVATQRFTDWVGQLEHRRLRSLRSRSRWYEWIRHPSKPKLFGGNIGIARDDYLRINGYDELFRGWGCEDDDLRLRLRAAGLRIRSILPWTQTYHLWHPKTPTAPDAWRDGPNVDYLRRSRRPIRCLAGVDQHPHGDTVYDDFSSLRRPIAQGHAA